MGCEESLRILERSAGREMCGRFRSNTHPSVRATERAAGDRRCHQRETRIRVSSVHFAEVIVSIYCLWAVFAGEVLFALHFDEAAGGALELKCDAVAAVELDGWGGG